VAAKESQEIEHLVVGMPDGEEFLNHTRSISQPHRSR
jgi:uncharacterized short protein YbdD (DUF466 family)